MTRIPDVIIERVHLGEATAEQRARVMADPEARARLEELAASDAAFLEAHPAREAVGEIQRRLHLARTRDAAAQRRRSIARGIMVLVPIAAVLLLVASLPRDRSGDPLLPGDGPGVERAKGAEDPVLFVYRKVRGQARSLGDGTVLLKGDQLQLGYRAGEATHGVLLSIDGRGAVTLHWPDDGNTALRTRGRIVLPHAYELDDAPEFERFFFVTGDEPVDVDAVRHAANAVAGTPDARTQPLPLSDHLDQQDFLVRKEVP